MAFFPQSFMPEGVVRRGLQNVCRALRPGGWVMVACMCEPGMELEATLSRLRDTLWGGDARLGPQLQVMVEKAGFTCVSVIEVGRAGAAKLVVGQRPSGPG